MAETIEPGEQWAYRERATAPVVQVEVLRMGTGRPPRLRIRHLDERYEGREEWVPPARLKVPWDRADQWIERDRQWTAAQEVSWRPYEDHELLAVDLVFDELVEHGLAHPGWAKNNGLLIVTDLSALVREFQIDVEVLTADPLGFVNDDGSYVAPWNVLLKVAEYLATHHADVLLNHVDRQEAEDRHASIHGRYLRGGRRGATYIEPEYCAQTAEEHKHVHEIMRRWCGAEPRERHDELVALRAEVRRLGHLVERAITTLQNAGRRTEAAAIERELGVPVETLRQAAAHQDRLNW